MNQAIEALRAAIREGAVTPQRVLDLISQPTPDAIEVDGATLAGLTADLNVAATTLMQVTKQLEAICASRRAPKSKNAQMIDALLRHYRDVPIPGRPTVQRHMPTVAHARHLSWTGNKAVGDAIKEARRLREASP